MKTIGVAKHFKTKIQNNSATILLVRATIATVFTPRDVIALEVCHVTKLKAAIRAR